ncbi:cysteine rich repeat-containing protein [Pseudorhodoplanes sinuspersici]|nr:cysteine rich repeat-containing protein [Pseudorhodoplanes sinuspersici]RKE70688.1 cysteine rich repeat protein [Pseudorhodoplanes sinuspersici]
MTETPCTVVTWQRFQWMAFATAILVASSMMPSPVLAQTKTGTLRDACREDYQRFCANVQRGGGRIRQCMLENASSLTPQCRDSLKALQEGQRQK